MRLAPLLFLLASTPIRALQFLERGAGENRSEAAEALRCPPKGIDFKKFPDNIDFQREAESFKHYMKPQGCLAGRRSLAASLLKSRQCKRIADIGGLLLRIVDDPEVPLAPELYVNIDPSTDFAAKSRPSRLSHSSAACEMELPLSTQQFSALPAEERDKFDFDCVVVLGAMAKQFSGGAMRAVLSRARLLVMDEAMTDNPGSPCANCAAFREARPLLHEMGFSPDATALDSPPESGAWTEAVSPLCEGHLPSGWLLDCRHARGPAVEDANLLVRQMAVYSRT